MFEAFKINRLYLKLGRKLDKKRDIQKAKEYLSGDRISGRLLRREKEVQAEIDRLYKSLHAVERIYYTKRANRL